MSRPKEPRFFDHMEGERIPPDHPHAAWLNDTIVTTREAYEALFAGAGDAKAIGEASPSYIRNPVVPRRVKALIPRVRLVAILREPVERAYASWLGSKRDGAAAAPTFEQALRDEELGRAPSRHQGFVAYGCYASQLERWYAVFPREQLRVYLFDDLLDDPHALLRDLHGFLGVDPDFLPDVTVRHGATGRIANPVLRVAWERSARARLRVRRHLPQGMRDRAYAWVVRDLVKPPMREETRAALRERLRPEVLALQDLLGRDLSHWLDS
jgi:hypothetical protein